MGGNGPGPVLGHQAKERGGSLDSQREEPPKPTSCLPAWPGWVRTLTDRSLHRRGRESWAGVGDWVGQEAAGPAWAQRRLPGGGDWALPETCSREQSQGGTLPSLDLDQPAPTQGGPQCLHCPIHGGGGGRGTLRLCV